MYNMTKNSLAFSKDEAVIMDHVARAAVNLAVLRRHDRTIVEIMDNSSHVVLYKFSNEQKTWVCLESARCGIAVKGVWDEMNVQQLK